MPRSANKKSVEILFFYPVGGQPQGIDARVLQLCVIVALEGGTWPAGSGSQRYRLHKALEIGIRQANQFLVCARIEGDLLVLA